MTDAGEKLASTMRKIINDGAKGLSPAELSEAEQKFNLHLPRQEPLLDDGYKPVILADRALAAVKKAHPGLDLTGWYGSAMMDWTNFARAELERAAEIADRFKEPLIGEEIRKLKD